MARSADAMPIGPNRARQKEAHAVSSGAAAVPPRHSSYELQVGQRAGKARMWCAEGLRTQNPAQPTALNSTRVHLVSPISKQEKARDTV